MRYLITGGAGSLGKALVKELSKDNHEIVVYSRDEGKHTYYKDYSNVKCVIGDVRDLEKLTTTFKRERPGIVIHAAALKRIDDMEHHPDECWKTNVIGSENVCKAATEADSVSKCMLVSTDKACMPINVYGASKFTAERIFSHYSTFRSNTKFASVRYGNVIASRGSFIPMWQEKLRNGETIPITHEECARFLFTLNDAVKFVLTSIDIMEGRGEVYVPYLKPYKIVDVLKVLQRMEGVQSPDVKIMGIRPGEKLHEDMLSEPEIPLSTVHFTPGPESIVRITSQVNTNESSGRPYTGKPMNTSLNINRDLDELEALIKRGLSETN